MTDDLKPRHYVLIDEKKCNGCVLCMKACPTKAIRIKEGKTAHIEGVCIYCGECIRVCPKGAIQAVTTGDSVFQLTPNATIIVSPVFFAQFEDDTIPNDILPPSLSRLSLSENQTADPSNR